MIFYYTISRGMFGVSNIFANPNCRLNPCSRSSKFLESRFKTKIRIIGHHLKLILSCKYCSLNIYRNHQISKYTIFSSTNKLAVTTTFDYFQGIGPQTDSFQQYLYVPFPCNFFQASHWPSDHMINSRPLIGQPSFPPLPPAAQKPLYVLRKPQNKLCVHS